jgi:plasmid stabilization system protein ParE
MKVVFTEVAQEQYNEIIYYLNAGFGKEKAQQF